MSSANATPQPGPQDAAVTAAPLATEPFSAIVALTKPGITRLVTMTSAVGFLLGALARPGDVGSLVLAAVGCLIGTALSAAGANTLNQAWEHRRDALMDRTRARPVPAGEISPTSAWLWGVMLGAFGVAVLALLAGPVASLISLATILLYVFVYTPSKVVSSFSTLVGAVPGALPPLIGWTAAAHAVGGAPLGGLGEWGGWTLFALMCVWQIPHFLAIAWMYRDDYAKGGYRMLPLMDPDGRITASTVLVWAVLLIPASMLPAWFVAERPLWGFALAAFVMGAVYVWACVPMVRERSRANAKRVFLGSIMHLPLLLIAMVLDAAVAAV